jgi:hypothetical protein
MRKPLAKTLEITRKADAPSTLIECNSVHPGGTDKPTRAVKTFETWHADPQSAQSIRADPIRDKHTNDELTAALKYLQDATQKAVEVEVCCYFNMSELVLPFLCS